MTTLVAEKESGTAASALVEKVVRALSEGNVGGDENKPSCAVLHRGLVLAGRILAISTPPYCTQSGALLVREENAQACILKKVASSSKYLLAGDAQQGQSVA